MKSLSPVRVVPGNQMPLTELIDRIHARGFASPSVDDVFAKKPLTGERQVARNEILAVMDELGVESYQISTTGSYRIDITLRTDFVNVCDRLGLQIGDQISHASGIVENLAPAEGAWYKDWTITGRPEARRSY